MDEQSHPPLPSFFEPQLEIICSHAMNQIIQTLDNPVRIERGLHNLAVIFVG